MMIIPRKAMIEVLASMGPRSSDRGNAASLMAPGDLYAGFNGAAII